MTRKAKPLPPKRRLFVAEYLKDQNATQAAIRAGYSRHTARAIGSELLTFPDVQAAIEKALGEVVRDAGVTVEWVLRRLIRNARVAFKERQMSASNKALELLGKHIGMFPDKILVPDPAKLTDEQLEKLERQARRGLEFMA